MLRCRRWRVELAPEVPRRYVVPLVYHQLRLLEAVLVAYRPNPRGLAEHHVRRARVVVPRDEVRRVARLAALGEKPTQKALVAVAHRRTAELEVWESRLEAPQRKDEELEEALVVELLVGVLRLNDPAAAGPVVRLIPQLPVAHLLAPLEAVCPALRVMAYDSLKRADVLLPVLRLDAVVVARVGAALTP